MLKAQSKIHEINEHRAATEEICSKKDDPDESEGMQLAGEAQAAINDVHDMDIGEVDGFDLKERIQKLNSDQLRVLKISVVTFTTSGNMNKEYATVMS